MSELDDYQLPPAEVTPRMPGLWQETSKWAIFSSIVGFLGTLVLLFYLVVLVVTVTTLLKTRGDELVSNEMAQTRIGSVVVLSVLLLLSGVAQFLGNFYHIRFASRLQRALNAQNQTVFELAWTDLRTHFRIYCLTLIGNIALLVGLLVYVMRTMPFLFSTLGEDY